MPMYNLSDSAPTSMAPISVQPRHAISETVPDVFLVGCTPEVVALKNELNKALESLTEPVNRYRRFESFTSYDGHNPVYGRQMQDALIHIRRERAAVILVLERIFRHGADPLPVSLDLTADLVRITGMPRLLADTAEGLLCTAKKEEAAADELAKDLGSSTNAQVVDARTRAHATRLAACRASRAADEEEATIDAANAELVARVEHNEQLRKHRLARAAQSRRVEFRAAEERRLKRRAEAGAAPVTGPASATRSRSHLIAGPASGTRSRGRPTMDELADAGFR